MDVQQDLTQVIEPIEKMMQGLSVNTVFGVAVKDSDQTVIPVASVNYAFGYGSGWGSGETQAGDEPPKSGKGGGSGAGGMGKATPQGVIRITPEGVHFEPAMNPKTIALAGIAMLAWNVFWITATVRAFARRKTG